MYSSKGDLTRLHKWVHSTHDTPLPVGLFVPYETAWKAVKEFHRDRWRAAQEHRMDRNRDLPPNTFPDP